MSPKKDKQKVRYGFLVSHHRLLLIYHSIIVAHLIFGSWHDQTET